MEHKNQRSITEDLKAALRERAQGALGKPIEDRYWVEEVQPGYNTGGYYDVDVPEKVVDRSDYFTTKEEAEGFLADQVPSNKSNFLRLRRETLYERTVQTWHRARV